MVDCLTVADGFPLRWLAKDGCGGVLADRAVDELAGSAADLGG